MDTLIPGNHSKGRSRPVDMLVIHVMEGTMAGTLSWFRNPAAQVSAHYGISRAGEVVQYVHERDTAWHAGRVLRPTARLVRERAGVNPNSYSIGIENEGTGKDPPTEAQIWANVDLIRTLCRRYAIPITRRHIVGHNEIYAGKTCPGLIDVDDLVRLAAAPLDIPAPSGDLAVAAPAAPEPPNLERIIVPTPAHIDEAVRVSSRWDADSVRDGIALVEVLLRGLQRGNVRHIAPAIIANALSEWLRRRTNEPQDESDP